MYRSATQLSSVLLRTGMAAAVLTGTVCTASAGGFAIREQSTVFLGSAFAGAAAGGSLGSMFWNSAATATFDGPGIHTESSYTLILPDADVTVSTVNGGPFPAGPLSNSGDIGIDAVVGASYASYQVSPDAWIGVAINSPFGLATKPDNNNYAGAVLGRTTKLLTLNVNPTVAYRVAPGITVGVGAQIEYGRGKLQFATAFPPGPGTAQFKGDDFAFGATAGIMVEPAAGTTIGLGWRSQLTHELDGNLSGLTVAPVGAKAEVKLPDIVTLSLRQAVASNMRVLGTVEWTNWSRLDALTVSTASPTALGSKLSIDTKWSDGWFFSAGGEYDYSTDLTLRAGAAYEISPVDDPSKRLTTIPDNDRVWLNIGASYKYSEATTLDFAYSHVFVMDGDFKRTNLSKQITETGSVDAAVDLISVGLRTRW
jgi:long-chain fatty acid transport protein